MYIFSSDGSQSPDDCTFSGEEIGADQPSLVLQVGKYSSLTINDKEAVIPVQQVYIHPKYIGRIKDELSSIEDSEFFTKTSNAIDTRCVVCDDPITDSERIVIKDDESREQYAQIHLSCLEIFQEKLTAAEKEIVSKTI